MHLRVVRPALALLGLLMLGLPGCAPVQPHASAPALPANLRQGLYPKWIDAQGRIKWPPNDGCAGAEVAVNLPEGTVIDRFGSEGGRFFSPRGERFAARALPYVCSMMAYTAYKVDRPLHVRSCKAAAWFGEPGGATQYETDDPAFRLRQSGAIEVLPPGSAGNAGPASPCQGS